jgi:YggT family protein
VTSLTSIISVIINALSLIVLADALVSFFLTPYHPIRRTLDSIVEPMLGPIRRVMPPTGALDLSPVVLLILIQIIGAILVQVLGSVR